eukprot:SAG31_NODE_31_length_32474_cov_18.308139_4_plen_1247_part_00
MEDTLQLPDARDGQADSLAEIKLTSSTALTTEARMCNAIETAFQVLDVTAAGHIGSSDLVQGFEMLGLHLSHAEAIKVMQQCDKDHNGTLELTEFAAMVRSRLNQTTLLKFKVKRHGPVPLFLLDAVPWGSARTTFRPHQITIENEYAPCGLRRVADNSAVSIQVQRVIFMIVRTGPFVLGAGAPVMALEILLIFVACSIVQLVARGANFAMWTVFPPVGWVILRTIVMCRRRRAECTLRVLGNPPPSVLWGAKGDFEVPLADANRVVEALLLAKGLKNNEKLGEFDIPLRGFGILPKCGGKGCCLGYNKISIGSRHFHIEKSSGGGLNAGPDSYRCCGGTEQLVGQIGVITWIHLHRQGKIVACCFIIECMGSLTLAYVSRVGRDIILHMKSILVTGVVVGIFAAIISMFLPKCFEVDACDLIHNNPKYATVATDIEFGLQTNVCHPSCQQQNCSVMTSTCADEPPPCLSHGDGQCDEPWSCPVGSDWGDCDEPSFLNTSQNVREWLSEFDFDAQSISVEAFLANSSASSLDALRTATAADVEQMISEMSFDSTSAQDAFRDAVAQLQQSPLTVDDWISSLRLDVSFNASLFDSLDYIRARTPTEVTQMILALELNSSAGDAFRLAVRDLQEAPTTIEEWFSGVRISGSSLEDHALAIGQILGTATTDTLDTLRTATADDVEQMISEMSFDSTSAQDAFRDAVAQLQQSPLTVDDWISSLRLDVSFNASLFDSLDYIRARTPTEVTQMILALELNSSAGDAFRLAVRDLQEAPTTIKSWLRGLDTLQRVGEIESYFATTATTLGALHRMSSSKLDEMFRSMRLAEGVERELRSAIEMLRATPAYLGAPMNLSVNWLADISYASSVWFKSLDSKLCKFQNDNSCDEPLRCPILTDSVDCDAAAREKNVLVAYSRSLSKHSSILGSIAVGLSENYHGACLQARAYEMCGGCLNEGVNRSYCAPGAPGFPTAEDLCRRVQLQGKLHETEEWCDFKNFREHADAPTWRKNLGADQPPCECLSMVQHFIPDWSIFLALWAVSWTIITIPQTWTWWHRLRCNVQLGVIGVDTRSANNIAQLRGKSGDCMQITQILLRQKLGRDIQTGVLKAWHRQLMASDEQLTLHCDYMHLKAVNKFPFCCQKCARMHTVDEYNVLLRCAPCFLVASYYFLMSNSVCSRPGIFTSSKREPWPMPRADDVGTLSYFVDWRFICLCLWICLSCITTQGWILKRRQLDKRHESLRLLCQLSAS